MANQVRHLNFWRAATPSHQTKFIEELSTEDLQQGTQGRWFWLNSKNGSVAMKLHFGISAWNLDFWWNFSCKTSVELAAIPAISPYLLSFPNQSSWAILGSRDRWLDRALLSLGFCHPLEVKPAEIKTDQIVAVVGTQDVEQEVVDAEVSESVAPTPEKEVAVIVSSPLPVAPPKHSPANAGPTEQEVRGTLAVVNFT